MSLSGEVKKAAASMDTPVTETRMKAALFSKYECDTCEDTHAINLITGKPCGIRELSVIVACPECLRRERKGGDEV